MQNINSVVITGNLTSDPRLNHTEAGTAVCNLRLAVNARRKNGNEEWVDKPNFFNVTVWGARGEACAEHLAKGRPVAVEGRHLALIGERVEQIAAEARGRVDVTASKRRASGSLASRTSSPTQHGRRGAKRPPGR